MKFVFVLWALVFVACSQTSHQNSVLDRNTAGIINGKNVDAKDPIAGQIVAITDNKWENCTGTLIAKNLVLTAAHCLTEDEPMFIAFGLSVNQRNLRSVDRRKVTAYRVAPGRENIDVDRQEFDLRDLLILKFEGGLPAGFQVAEFLPANLHIENDMEVIVAGYGVTSGSKQQGDGTLRKTYVPVQDVNFAKTEIQTDESRTGTCNIDSGGPAFVELQGKIYYWGVTSRGASNCKGDGVYTKISAFQDWVNATIQELGAK